MHPANVRRSVPDVNGVEDSSSKTKIVPARGALNAAASPMPAPIAVKSLLAEPSFLRCWHIFNRLKAMEAPIRINGPSFEQSHEFVTITFYMF